MSKQPRLVDADKIIAEMEERVQELLRDPDKTYDVYPVANALCNYIDRLKSDRYLPTPPVQPDTPKPGDKVRHIIHGTGVVDNLAIRRYLTVQFPDMYTGCWAEELEVIQPDTGEVITDEQR